MDLCFVFSDLQPIVVTSVQSLFYGSSRKKFRLSENKGISVLVIVEVLMYREQKKYKYSDTANDSNGNRMGKTQLKLYCITSSCFAGVTFFPFLLFKL